MKQYLIIVAGGKGSRMQNNLPKQFVKVHGKEIIIHTIEKFLSCQKNLQLIIAVHEDYLKHTATLLEHNDLFDVTVVKGGNTRYQSVKNALQVINDAAAIVGIHDAARPCVNAGTIERCYSVAREKGNAVPAINLNESIREVKTDHSKALNRSDYKIIQTPQCFRVSEIKKAFELPYNETFTDDAAVLEANGGIINLVEGNEENIKITFQKDLLMAKIFLENE